MRSVTAIWQVVLGGALLHDTNTLKGYHWNHDIIGDSSDEDRYYAICFVATKFWTCKPRQVD